MSTENSQAYWEAFARARSVGDDAQTAGLALHGSEPLYDAYRDRAERIAVHKLLPKLDPGWRVLDLGCGPGRWTVPLAQVCGSVVAVDFSDQMLHHAHARLRAVNVAQKVRLVRADLQTLEPAQLGPPFDLLFCCGVLQYLSLDALKQLIPKLTACVKPGGLLLHREYRARKSFERVSTAGDVSLRSYYKNFADYWTLFSQNGFALRGRRSILPPNLLYSMYARFKPPAGDERTLREIIYVHEVAADRIWRMFPRLLWWVNSWRETDNMAALYQKTA